MAFRAVAAAVKRAIADDRALESLGRVGDGPVPFAAAGIGSEIPVGLAQLVRDLPEGAHFEGGETLGFCNEEDEGEDEESGGEVGMGEKSCHRRLFLRAL